MRVFIGIHFNHIIKQVRLVRHQFFDILSNQITNSHFSPSLVKPDPHGIGMSIQTLGFSQFNYIIAMLIKPGGGISNQTGLLHKGIHIQR